MSGKSEKEGIYLEAPKPHKWPAHDQITIQNPLIRPPGHLLPMPGAKGKRKEVI